MGVPRETSTAWHGPSGPLCFVDVVSAKGSMEPNESRERNKVLATAGQKSSIANGKKRVRTISDGIMGGNDHYIVSHNERQCSNLGMILLSVRSREQKQRNLALKA